MAQTVTPVYAETNYVGEDPELARLYDNVQAMVPAVLLPVVKMVVWNTIEDFYIRSTWRRELLNWCLPDRVTCIDFNPYDGDWLVCWILDIYGHGRYAVKPPAQLIDVQTPPVSGTREGQVLVALKPVSIDAEFDPMLFSTWFETILDGVLHRLYLQPAKPYSSPQLAQAHGRRYRSGVQGARAIAQKQYTNGPGRWVFPYFGTGVRKS
jgi:hypothetical protein